MWVHSWGVCAYCLRDAGADLRQLSGQHGQSSRRSFPQPLVVLSAVEHKQLQAIAPCGKVQFLHLRTHQTPVTFIQLVNTFVPYKHVWLCVLPLCLKPNYTCTLWQRLGPGRAPQTCSLRFLGLPSPLWSFVWETTSIKADTLYTDRKQFCQKKRNFIKVGKT